eukprot:278720-Prorocentrum_minimum.AAC.1
MAVGQSTLTRGSWVARCSYQGWPTRMRRIIRYPKTLLPYTAGLCVRRRVRCCGYAAVGYAVGYAAGMRASTGMLLRVCCGYTCVDGYAAGYAAAAAAADGLGRRSAEFQLFSDFFGRQGPTRPLIP